MTNQQPTARVDVALGARSYPIFIGSGTLSGLGETIRSQGLKNTAALVITNPQVGALYFDTVAASLAAAGFDRVVRHDIPANEEGKNWETFTAACAALAGSFPDTGTVPVVVALGGGVVGDLGGFAAGVFRRGVPFVQVPTTLLSAVDSSVGGKVGVNFGPVKNLMGIFNQPRLVCCDLAVLTTLSARELRSGSAEVIKYGGVCSAALFERLERGGLEQMLALEPAALVEIVAVCCRLKADVVEQDELDQKGIRNVLNFGHTVGHALEMAADYTLTHGEAISVGMVAATRLACSLGWCDADFEQRLFSLFDRAGLPTSHPDAPGLFDRIMASMQSDKKFKDGKNLFVLPTAIGKWETARNVAWENVHAAVRSVLRSA